ncbi:hypothetical protein O7598_04965 [Micromonospora sp. WMMC241]|uniref:hypothetical protein n=1 Tax=Micromonospora sp. WMMC241 TaxID=3015159 RepID=UPI0022B5E93F|nr:hypothetical protein [Micromonospora sp. WMMC241]MCZ7435737.1 hypothetical protein [Micromonospora sp. WMMC241]
MTDLDQRIASVLRERAEGEIDARRLLRGSRALGRRRQVRRRVTAGTALALVGVLGFVGVVKADVGGLAGRLPWTATTPAVAPPPVPPLADGVPGAAVAPARVGTDPGVLHFAIDPGRARYLGWGAHAGTIESVRFSVGSGTPVLVEVTATAGHLDDYPIEGLPVDVVRDRLPFDGTVQRARGNSGLLMSWQPVRGLYARASTTDLDQAALRRAVEVLRFDTARRCAGPVRLTDLPAGARVVGCDVDVSSFPGLVTANLTVNRDRTHYMWLRYRYASHVAGSRTEGNRTIAGRPAYLSPDGTTLELLGQPKVDLVAQLRWAADGTGPPGFTEAEAGTLLGGAKLATDPTDSKTWP